MADNSQENSCYQAALPRFDWQYPPLSYQGALALISDAVANAAAKSTGSGGLSGAGSPEGVATANPGTTYWDTTNQLFYVKDNGTSNTGWAIH